MKAENKTSFLQTWQIYLTGQELEAHIKKKQITSEHKRAERPNIPLIPQAEPLQEARPFGSQAFMDQEASEPDPEPEPTAGRTTEDRTWINTGLQIWIKIIMVFMWNIMH